MLVVFHITSNHSPIRSLESKINGTYFDSKQLIKFGDEQFTSLGEYSLTYKLPTLAEAGELEDGHMSSESHKRVADLIYKYIIKNG